ncbi:MAG TPA: VCBS repeat-containing protein, partial [Candidatus Manganitrophaceae bacterium]
MKKRIILSRFVCLASLSSVLMIPPDGSAQTVTFVRSAQINVGAGSREIAAGDWNLDGRLDLVVGNALLIGNGAGGFTIGPSTGIGGQGGIAAGDWNLDGKPDLASSDGLNEVSIFL